MAGICLAEWLGPGRAVAQAITFALPVVVVVAALALAVRCRLHPGLWQGLVAALALSAGFARHQSAVLRGPEHVTHALQTEPLLTRLVGRVVTTPVERPGVRRNLFLPFEPPPHTQFVLAAEEFVTADGRVLTTGQVRVSVEALDLKLALGGRVQVTGRLYGLSGPRNPGETDWSQFFRYQGIDAGMAVEGAAHVAVLPDPPGAWHRLVSSLRGTARSLLFEPYADLDADAEVRLLDTMVLGQRRAADEKLNEAFLRAGALHMLAVSGFNVNILAVTAWWLVRRVLRRGRVAAAVTALVAIVLFALVTEPNAPVLRATVVGVIATVGALLHRPLCLMNALALAAGFVLLLNPLELFRAGFQLSFVQVLAFVTVLPVVWEWIFRRQPDGTPRREAQTTVQLVIRTAQRALLGALLASLVAWVISLPLQLVHFGYITPWGWLGSLLLALPVLVATVLSLLTLTANALIPPLGLLLGVLLRWSVDAVLWLVELFPKLPGTLVPWRPAPTWLALGTYLAMLWLFWPRRAQQVGIMQRRAVPLCVVVVTWVLWVGWTATDHSHDFALHVLAVGNGSAMVLQAPEGPAAVFDVGTDTNTDAGEVVAQAFQSLGGGRVELVSVSHANFDHYSGLPTLLARVPVARWATNPSFAGQDAADSPLGRLRNELPPVVPAPDTLRAGDRRRIGDVTVEVLWPPDQTGLKLRDNDTSLVLRLTIAGHRILLTGDIEKAALQELVRRHAAGELDLRAEVLVAPHHGSVVPKATADFCAAVSPEVVLVSTRTPRPKLERLVAERLGTHCRVLLTRDVGAVCVRVTPAGELQIETPLAAARFTNRPSSGFMRTDDSAVDP
jgi:competence protein ComEC